MNAYIQNGKLKYDYCGKLYGNKKKLMYAVEQKLVITAGGGENGEYRDEWINYMNHRYPAKVSLCGVECDQASALCYSNECLFRSRCLDEIVNTILPDLANKLMNMKDGDTVEVPVWYHVYITAHAVRHWYM